MRLVRPTSIVTSLLFFASCQSDCRSAHPPQDREFSRPISVDSANRMINSYLTAINYEVNKNEIRSIIVDVDALQEYVEKSITEDKEKRIVKLKFIFAHTLDYINAGGEGKRPDSNSAALTLVIAGIDKRGDYVLPGGMAMDYCQPCPHRCPEGTAAESTLPKSYQRK